jgi:hypothetical protein
VLMFEAAGQATVGKPTAGRSRLRKITPARSNVEPFVERNGVLRTSSMSTVNGVTCRNTRDEHGVCGDGSSRNA